MTEPLDDRRLDELVDLIVQLASGDLSARLEPSPARDSVDAVITGINMLADELDMMTRTLEERVVERTTMLDQAKRELEHLALYDALTGLANRTLLEERIKSVVSSVQQPDEVDRRPCLLLLDLDEFKAINDGLGHSAGDRILIEVAGRLSTVVRETDTVARLGGDEFAILLPHVGAREALRIAERALVELQKPYQLGNRTVWTAASIGVRFGDGETTADLLLRDADTAMYAAKAQGRANLQVFRAEMHQAAQARLQVATELGGAIAGGQLRLRYQPIVELATGTLVGTEALVRWAHPSRGLLAPADFLAIAEDSGHIAELGRWVIRAGVVQLERWLGHGVPPDFRLHVNLSPMELRWPGLVDYVGSTFERFRIPPSRLTVEISETGLVLSDSGGLGVLLKLRQLGTDIAVDDFGTGYSSISYLRRLPIDAVKVDQSLVSGIGAEGQQVEFVAAILRLIDSVGLRSVVEGIESTAQMEQLMELGCRFGQGHHLSPPLRADEMADLLSSSRRLPL